MRKKEVGRLTALLLSAVLLLSHAPVTALAQENAGGETGGQPASETMGEAADGAGAVAASVTDGNNSILPDQQLQTVSGDNAEEFVLNDESGIPDAALYAALLQQGDEMNGNKDGILAVKEAEKIYYVNCSSEIASYTNLAEFCPNIGILNVSNSNTQSWNSAEESFILEYGKLQKLRSITISVYSDFLLEAICANRSLTGLTLTLGNDMSNDLSPVIGLPLQSFSVSGVKAGSGIEAVVNSLEELNTLTINGVFDEASINGDRKAGLESVSFFLNDFQSEPRSYDLSGYVRARSISMSLPIQSVTGMEELPLTTLTLYNTADTSGTVSILPDGLNQLNLVHFAVDSLESDSRIIDLTNLRELNLSNCGMKDISGISKLSLLSQLSLAHNELTDISEVAQLNNLYLLNLTNNQISDVAGLEKLVNLQYLYLAGNRLEALPDLTKLSQLSSGNMPYYSGLTLENNLLGREDIVGYVPEKFSNNRIWLAYGTTRRINSMICFADLDVETIVDILFEYNPPGEIRRQINVMADGEIVCTPEFVKLIKEKKLHLTLNFVDESGTSKVRYYLDSNDSLPDIEQDVVLKYVEQPASVAEKEAAEEYLSEFGDIPIYYYLNCLAKEVQGIPRDYLILEPQLDPGTYNIYFYDYKQQEITKLKSVYYYQRNVILDNYSNNTGNARIVAPELNRTQEEGYYFFASSKYQPVSSTPGEYSVPSIYKGEILGSGAELDKALTEMISSAKAKDTLSFAFKNYGYVNADSWNEAFKKKLNWEITYLDNNDCIMSVVKMDGNSIQKVKGGSTVDLSAAMYTFYPPEPLSGYFKGLTAGAVSRADLSLREEISLYVGKHFKNGETLNSYFLRTPVFTGTGNNTVLEDNTYKLWKSGAEPVTVDRGMVTLQVKDKKGTLLLVNGVLDLKADPEPETPVEPEPEEPETPVVPAPEEPETPGGNQPSVDGKQPPLVIDDSRIVDDSKVLDTITESFDKLNPNVEVYTKKPVTLDKKLFQDMSKKNKNVSVSVANEDNQLMYGWTFQHSRISEEKLKEFEKLDLGITFATEKQKEIESITHNSDALYLSFSHHGELPAPAEIKTYVGNKYPDGAVVYLYYYNEDTKQVEAINGSQGLTVSGGYVTYTITHCSIYFLAEAAPEQMGISGGSGDGSDSGAQGEGQTAAVLPAAVKSPKTGEETSRLSFYILALLMGFAFMVVIYRKKKE